MKDDFKKNQCTLEKEWSKVVNYAVKERIVNSRDYSFWMAPLKPIARTEKTLYLQYQKYDPQINKEQVESTIEFIEDRYGNLLKELVNTCTSLEEIDKVVIERV